MCLLFETIKVIDGTFYNLDYHSKRLNFARQELYSGKNIIYLEDLLKVPENMRLGVVKCKVEYRKKIENIEFTAYNPRKINSFKLVYDDEISYSYKFSDRSRLENLKQNITADEILIVKKGLITDTSFSNIIFFDGKKWVTPSTPLLKGTKRQELLKKEIISEQLITPSDLKNFKKAKLINAMLDFEDSTEIEIKNIS